MFGSADSPTPPLGQCASGLTGSSTLEDSVRLLEQQRQGTSFPKGPASRSLYRRADRSEASGVKIRSLSSCVNSSRKSIDR